MCVYAYIYTHTMFDYANKNGFFFLSWSTLIVLLKFLRVLLALYFEILSFLSSALYFPTLKFPSSMNELSEIANGLEHDLSLVLVEVPKFCPQTKPKKYIYIFTIYIKKKRGIEDW